MKKTNHKIISVLMAFVVFISTMSFLIDMHYCGDTLVDTAVFHKAETCGMKMQNSSTKDCSITKKNCCSNKQLMFNGQDELQFSVDYISFEQQEQFIALFFYTYTTLFQGVDEDISIDQDYKPPLLISQLYKIDETFLI